MRKYLRGVGRGEFGSMLVERWLEKGGNLAFEAGYLRGRVSFGRQEKEGLMEREDDGVVSRGIEIMESRSFIKLRVFWCFL